MAGASEDTFHWLHFFCKKQIRIANWRITMIRRRKTITTRATKVSLAKPKIDVSSIGVSEGIKEEGKEGNQDEEEVEVAWIVSSVE